MMWLTWVERDVQAMVQSESDRRYTVKGVITQNVTLLL